MQLHYLVHRLNHTFPLPRGRRTLSSFAQKYINMPHHIDNARIHHGLVMDLDMHDPLDVSVYFNVMDMEVLAAIRQFVKSGDTVLDIGANIGYFSLLMAHEVGNRGAVHAFEPNPTVCDRLKAHALMNGYKDVIRVHNLAIGETSSSSDLYLYAGTHGHSSLEPRADRAHSSIETKVETLDELYSRGDISLPSFVKIDTEGAELLGLRGGEQLIQQSRPVIVCEISPAQKSMYGYTAEDIWAWAAAHNYSFGFLQPYKRVRSVEIDDVSSLPEGNILLKPIQID